MQHPLKVGTPILSVLGEQSDNANSELRMTGPYAVGIIEDVIPDAADGFRYAVAFPNEVSVFLTATELDIAVAAGQAPDRLYFILQDKSVLWDDWTAVHSHLVITLKPESGKNLLGQSCEAPAGTLGVLNIDAQQRPSVAIGDYNLRFVSGPLRTINSRELIVNPWLQIISKADTELTTSLIHIVLADIERENEAIVRKYFPGVYVQERASQIQNVALIAPGDTRVSLRLNGSGPLIWSHIVACMVKTPPDAPRTPSVVQQAFAAMAGDSVAGQEQVRTGLTAAVTWLVKLMLDRLDPAMSGQEIRELREVFCRGLGVLEPIGPRDKSEKP